MKPSQTDEEEEEEDPCRRQVETINGRMKGRHGKEDGGRGRTAAGRLVRGTSTARQQCKEEWR